MSPSGLVFLVIVAIWAAYFTQYWVRRREHLSTARSMDRFSESMRVLARRSPGAEPSLTSATAPTYAVPPASSAGPSVLLRQADLMHDHAHPPEASMSVSPAPARVPSTPTMDDAGSRRSLRPARVACGLLLLAAVPACVVVAFLAGVSVLLWWAPVVPFLVALLAVLGLRLVTRLEQSRARADRTAERSAARRRSAEPSATRSAPAPPTAARSGSTTGAADTGGSTRDVPSSRTSAADHGPAAVAAEATGAAPAARTGEPTAAADQAAYEVFDGDPAPEPVLAPAPVALVDEDDIPLTWDPRPVPRPTYTMKARVEHPRPAVTGPERLDVEVDVEDSDAYAPAPRRASGA